MKIKELIKFEPINITQIIITVSVLLIVIYSFKTLHFMIKIDLLVQSKYKP